MKRDMVRRFFNWINERHHIYLMRQAGEPWPWTEDEILKTYRFTNVFRELDAGTVWLRENWREPFADSPTLFFNICLYRQFNRIETAEFLGYVLSNTDEHIMLRQRLLPNGKKLNVRIWAPNTIASALRDHKENGFPIYTSAHMVTGQLGVRGSGSNEKYPVKSDMTIYAILDPLWENQAEFAPRPGDTLQTAYERLLAAPGFGPFVTYEVITDLRHTRYLHNAPDIMTWANPGPGAKRGINRLHGLQAEPNNQLVRQYYLECMQKLLEMANTGDDLEGHVPGLEMRDIEHSLCEFDKYERVRNGEGRPRRRFIYSGG